MALREYQKDAVRHLHRRGGSGGLWMEPGTGKTRTALALEHLMPHDRILVVGPTSIPRIWRLELEHAALWGWKHHFVSLVGRGSSKTKAKWLRKLVTDREPFLVVVNYESYWREPLKDAIRGAGFQMVIYDESHRLAHRSSKQSRFAHLLRKDIPLRLGLSGTPAPNGYQDLFSVYKALDPTVFGDRWADFSWRYLKMGGFQGYQVIGYRNENVIKRKVRESSYAITKDDALDLPEYVDTEIGVELEPKTRKVYESMRKDALAAIRGVTQGSMPVDGISAALTPLTKLMRLQQITSGFTRTVDDTLVEMSFEKAKVLDDLLSDLMEAESKRVVVFCRFTHDVNDAMRVAEKHGEALLLDGSVPIKDRDGVLESFRATQKGILVAQIQVGSLGIDLTCSDTAIFFSVDFSLTNYLQARDRLHRDGQTNKVTYYHLIAEGTVDEKVYRVLADKGDLQKALTSKHDALEFFS